MRLFCFHNYINNNFSSFLKYNSVVEKIVCASSTWNVFSALAPVFDLNTASSRLSISPAKQALCSYKINRLSVLNYKLKLNIKQKSEFTLYQHKFNSFNSYYFRFSFLTSIIIQTLKKWKIILILIIKRNFWSHVTWIWKIFCSTLADCKDMKSI